MQRLRDILSAFILYFRVNIKRLKKQPIFRDKVFIIFGLFTILTYFVVTVVLLLGVKSRNFNVPLEYSSTIGFTKLAPWYHTYSYGVFAFVVTFLNLLLASVCFRKSRISSFFLVYGALFINVLLLVIIINLLASQDI